MKPEEVYDTLVNLDRRVRLKPVDFPYRSPKPNPPTGSLPGEYLRWAESATDDEVDRFWYYISEGDWRRAKQISGLSSSVIADILANFHAGPPEIHGRSTINAFVFDRVPLHRFLMLMQLAPDRYRKYYNRYANNRHAPPYQALPKRAKEAFEYLAEKVEEELK